MNHQALGFNKVENTWAGGEGELRLKQVVQRGENATSQHTLLAAAHGSHVG